MKKFRLLGRIAAVLFSAILLMTGTVPSYAAEWIDLNKEGSISLTLLDKEKNQPVAGGEFTLYQVAGVAVDDGDLSFVYTNGWEECGIALDNLEDSALAGKLEGEIPASAAKVTRMVGEDGTVKFSGLSLGLYLLVQTKTADGYNEVSSFLVSVPLQEDGTYIYEVDASPKVEKASVNSETPNTPTEPAKPNVLPKTGQLDWPIPVLSVAGILLFAFGWSLRRERKQYAA